MVSIEKKDGKLIRIPLWAISLLGTSLLYVAYWIGSVVSAEVDERGKTIERHDQQLAQTEVKLKYLETFAERTDGKLDRILELMRDFRRHEAQSGTAGD